MSWMSLRTSNSNPKRFQKPSRYIMWKGLKWKRYMTKFFYLAEDAQTFYTKRYANGKDVAICEHEIADVDDNHCALCLEGYQQRKEEWIKCLGFCQQWYHEQCFLQLVKGCVRYIFTSLFSISKREHLWNNEKCFLFHFVSSFRSWDNQILSFQIFKCNDVIKCPSTKHGTHFIE